MTWTEVGETDEQRSRKEEGMLMSGSMPQKFRGYVMRYCEGRLLMLERIDRRRTGDGRCMDCSCTARGERQVLTEQDCGSVCMCMSASGI